MARKVDSDALVAARVITRAVALKNASATGTACACTGAGQGTISDLGARADGAALRAGLQLLSSAAGGIKIFIQANSSSGYTATNPGTDVAAFTSRACRDSQWAHVPWNCASATSTQRQFYRATWTQTCTSTHNWLAAVSIEP